MTGLAPGRHSFTTAPVTGPAYRPYLWMLLSTFWFACMGALTHEVGQTLDWQVIAMFRSFLPFGIVIIFALAAGTRLVLWQPKVLWLRSIAGSISLVATFFALTRLPVADVFTITNTFPIWVAVLSWPVNGEMPTSPVWLSAITAAAGVYIIQQPHFDQENWAVIVALIASFSTAVAMMGLNRLKHVDTRAVIVHFSGVAFCFAAAAFFAFDHPREAVPQGIDILELAGVGLAATIGQVFLTKAFMHGDAAKVSVLGPTQVVWAVLLDVFVLGHEMTTHRLLGIPLVLAPTAYLLWYERGRARPTSDSGGVSEGEGDLP